MDKFNELAYRRPDFADCKKRLKAVLRQIRGASSYADFRDGYLGMEAVIKEVYTASSIASIRNTVDTTDSFYEAEDAAISAGSGKLSLMQQKIVKAMSASPFRGQFDEEYGPHLMKSMEMQANLVNPLILPDMVKVNKLRQVYSKTVATSTTEFRGEQCNFYGLLKHMESTDREERAEAFRAWAAMYERISGQLDETYDKLVRIRVREAKKLGFKNYIDYIYLDRGRFDYTAKEAECFRNQVRDVIVPVCAELYRKQAERLGVEKLHWYDEGLTFPEGNALPRGNKDELVAKALAMYKKISPETGEYFQFMCDHELFDLETKPGKRGGGYCTFLPDYKAPFIFSNFNGTSADVDVLTHEAGHAFQAYISSRTLPLANQMRSTSEVQEIHSMAMEHFAYPYMEDFFGENADKYRYAHLCDALTTIPYLVAVDEFQHRVFENPSMSAMERRAAWHRIEEIYLPWRDYDGNEFLEQGGFWMQKQHVFLFPFYYIEYAMAQICAFQFFAKDLEDHDAAWNGYLNLCKSGGSRGYFDTLENAGLMNPLKEGTVEKVVEIVKAKIDEFEAKL